MNLSRMFFIVFSAAVMMMMTKVKCLQHRNDVVMKWDQWVPPLLSTRMPLNDDFLHNHEIRHIQDNSDDDGRHALRVLQTSQIADAPFECPVKWGKFPIPDDCSSFYNCVSSNARKKKCPDGQYFDKFFKKCDKQDEVDCNSEVTAPSTITFKCPFSWGPYPYPEDCSRHYLCLFGKPSIKKCEKKMLFDANKKKCEDEEKVDCGSRFNPYATTTALMTTKSTQQTKPILISTTPLATTTPKTTTTELKTTKTFPPTEVTDEQTASTTLQPTTASIQLISDGINSTTSGETSQKTEYFKETSEPTEISTTEKDETVNESTTETGLVSSDEITLSPGQETTPIQETTHSPTEENTSPSSVHETPTSIQETPSSIQDTPFSIQETTVFSTTMEIPTFDCPKAKGVYPHEENCAWYFICKNSIASFRKCPSNTKFHKIYKQCFNEREVACD